MDSNDKFAAGQKLGQDIAAKLTPKKLLRGIAWATGGLACFFIPLEVWDDDETPEGEPAPVVQDRLPEEEELCVVCGLPSPDGETHPHCRS